MTKPYQKGRAFEEEKAREITQYFKDFGCKFIRIGGIEKHKITRLGDIGGRDCWKCGHQDYCPLREYFWELEFRDNPQVLRKWKKAMDDAQYKKPLVWFKKTHSVEGIILRPKDFLSLLYSVFETKIK